MTEEQKNSSVEKETQGNSNTQDSVQDSTKSEEQKSFIQELREIFMPKQKEQKNNEAGIEPEKKADDEKPADDVVTLSKSELEKLVEEKAAESVTKIAAKTKKKTETKIKIDEAMTKVDPEFKELIEAKYKADEAFDIDAYLKEHPSFAINRSNSIVSEKGNLSVSNAMSDYLKFYNGKRG